ncbi:PhaM family polyhydroxyalkanoate granule multifunctional regulatory protein [Variovorax sp. ZT4R33]|uniref:PhaM family polyhydroxyalkanoate granule multifunctional regulatory protein n=1 Tax=Variovorax sp. ZT4R33 TaxID=3443743 RepID=UPI003F448728
MNDATSPFAFSQFVPGFDFLKNLAGGTAPGGGSVAGMPSLSSWVAPTLSVEEVDKRIQELKTVQYWLEQNGHALRATIQALEVQKMTLSTLRGMNVQMEDLAKAFTATVAPPVSAPTASVEPADEAPAPPSIAQENGAEPPADAPENGRGDDAKATAPGVVDPLQWWNALTQQFQHIAQTAMHDAGQLKMPGAATTAKASARPPAAKKAAARKAAATKKITPAARKAAAAPRARGR